MRRVFPWPAAHPVAVEAFRHMLDERFIAERLAGMRATSQQPDTE
jgi:hypothetical protein